MTLQQLIEAGLTNEQATAVIKIHKETIDGAYVTKDRFNEVNDDLKNQKQAIVDRDKQIEDIKKQAKEVDGLSETITQLQADNKEAKEKFDSELSAVQKNNALKVQLLADDKTKPHDVEMVAAQFDMSTIVVDENGTIKSGYKEQHESIVKNKAFLFSVVDSGDGEGSGDGNGKPDVNNWWKPISNKPADSSNNQATAQEKSVSFGAGLAAKKNAQMGITPANKE